MTESGLFDISPFLDEAGRAALPVLHGAIAQAGGEARLVGGAVRDALRGRPCGDLDLATTLAPEGVMKALAAVAVKTVPTGLAHGTVTAVMDHRGYEITTLRRDVATDGRRAEVAFTDDWREDAARRDFTLNALYLDAEGRLYDYFGGREDLAAGRVRFIGDPRERLREDILRILRFFRFNATLGHGAAPDPEGLEACRAMAPHLPRLSAERVWKEVARLLESSDPAPTWRLMESCGVLRPFLVEARNAARLSALCALEKTLDLAPSPLRRFAALLDSNEAGATEIARRLRLPNRATGHVALLASLPSRVVESHDRRSLRRLLYAFGIEAVTDALLLAALAPPGFAVEETAAALATVRDWTPVKLPVQGQDLLALGVPPGPPMGQLLRAVESWWQDADFRPDRAACLAEARRRKGALS